VADAAGVVDVDGVIGVADGAAAAPVGCRDELAVCAALPADQASANPHNTTRVRHTLPAGMKCFQNDMIGLIEIRESGRDPGIIPE